MPMANFSTTEDRQKAVEQIKQISGGHNFFIDQTLGKLQDYEIKRLLNFLVQTAKGKMLFLYPPAQGDGIDWDAFEKGAE